MGDLAAQINAACIEVVASSNPSMMSAQLLVSKGCVFTQPGQRFHEYYRWRLGELRTEGMTGDKVLPTDADLNAIEDAVAEVGADIQAIDAFLLNAGKKFVMPGHPTYEYFRWRISLLQAPQLSRKKGHVTITVDDSAEKNTPISVGQLLVLLAPLLENGQCDPGLFIDPNGHVVLPASIFEDKANEAQEY